MNETEPTTDLAARIRAVDGVTDVYAFPVGLARISGLVGAATGTSDDASADIAVTVRDGVPTVAARIAASVVDSAPEAARRVADVLLAGTPEDARITIQIARIS